MADGDVLSLTLSHVFTDGVRVSLLLSQLAARYRLAVGALDGNGKVEAPFPAPVDDRKSILSVDAMRRELGG